ncbi:MAG: NUDIX hydrolase [Pseudomonadota bacterium]
MGINQHNVEFRFCPACGGALKTSVLKPNEPPRLVCGACEFIFYLDPKVVVCTILEMDGKILLLKRGINPQKGKWVMPGGYVDRNEEVKAAAIRETQEESGLKISIGELVGVYSYPGNLTVVIVYTSQYLAGELLPKDETLEAKWFPKEEIPWDKLAFQSTMDALKDYCKIHKASSASLR